jgi:hypothetical protein
MNEMSVEQWRKDAEEEKGKKWGKARTGFSASTAVFLCHYHSISVTLATPLFNKTHSPSYLVRVCNLQHRPDIYNRIHSRSSMCLIQAPYQDVGDNGALHILISTLVGSK